MEEKDNKSAQKKKEENCIRDHQGGDAFSFYLIAGIVLFSDLYCLSFVFAFIFV